MTRISHPRDARSASGGRPAAEQPPDENQLSHVICRVIGDEQQLTDVRLVFALRNPRAEVDGRIRGELLERGPVLPILPYRLVPRAGGGRFGRSGPVVSRPFALPVLRGGAEVEDVLLRDPQVLEELPSGVRQSGRLGATDRAAGMTCVDGAARPTGRPTGAGPASPADASPLPSSPSPWWRFVCRTHSCLVAAACAQSVGTAACNPRSGPV